MKINNEKIKTIIAAVAAVAMYFIPPPIDGVITAILGVIGVTEAFTLKKN